ncbi:MAG TPA: hypothetical protein VMT29_01990 [Steroidobacteraceae bacterium]|nr:hypothetical protein [Steroidobacteraceae bacterium]
MKFRLKAFGLHLLGSACVLALVLGALYLGWYRWPGWYLTGVLHVTAILAGVDVTLGPLFTLLIANPNKPRRELARDIAVIVALQVVALAYGSATLWRGRPLYYTFSSDRLEIVQASEIPPEEIALALKQNPDFAPHWYSRPRWVWAPLPDDPAEQSRIMAGAVSGEGPDVIQMPRYFKPWAAGHAALRQQLKPADQFFIFTKTEKQTLKRRLQQHGLPSDQADTIFLSGHDRPLLAVFDPATLHLKAILRAD